MALSGSTDFSLTAREVIRYAMRKTGLSSATDGLDANDTADALRELNLMLKGWQMTGLHLWKKTEGAITITDATASYALSGTLNPLRILSVRFRQNSIDLPMEELTRSEYFDLPQKSSAGTPTQYYFDPQRSEQTLYVWPVLASASGETFQVTYQKRFDDLDDVNNDIDIPTEWLQTVGYNLAALLADTAGTSDQATQRIIARAQALLQEAKDYDREDHVVFTMDAA